MTQPRRVTSFGVRRLLFVIALGVGTAVLAGCETSRGETKDTFNATSATALPVRVATVQTQPAPIAIRAIGTIEPLATVTIRSQVAGRLTKVDFADGQEVKKGDVLFEIDPRPSQAALQLAKANLTRDQALAADAERDARRLENLYEKGTANSEERDTARANADAKTAQVHADEAMVEQAQLDLEYCTIHAPLTGRLGARLVDPGDIIKVNDTALVVLNQISPIYVSFSVPERYLEDIHGYAAAGPLVVEARFPHGDDTVERGALTFIDNQVDRTTGMIKLRGTFANEDRRMWPGQYVDASLILTTRPDAIVAPTKAVQAGPEGQFVFVVKPDQTVEMREVHVGEALDGLSVIDSGLKAGEQVVTDGQLRLTPGARVKILADEAPSAAQPAAGLAAGAEGGA